MAHPVVGADGAVTSWGSANFYSTLLAATRPMSARVEILGEAIDVSGLGVNIQSSLAGLKSWTAMLRGYSFATPRLGNVGIVATSGSEYVTNVQGFNINIETVQVHDITALNIGDTLSGGAPLWRRFRPDYTRFSGTFDAGIDSTAALTVPPNPTASLPTFTFTYGTNATLAGALVITGCTPNIERGQRSTVTYSFTGSGALTPAGASSIFGTTAFAQPLWTGSDSTAGALVITAASGRTLTGYDSFWRRLGITCRVGEAVMVEADVVGSGAIVPA